MAGVKQAAKEGQPARRRRRGFVRRALRWCVRLLFLALALAAAWVALYRVVPPPGGIYMAGEAIRLGGVERDWVGFDQISPDLARAVMAGEDARFCEHMGFDLDAIRAALEEREQGRVRGASTITQQTAKNVFLWHGRSWARKGLEAGFAGLMELIWPKRRILEVYLNSVEFAPGVFGAEAAARRLFGRSAAELSADQAARLAAVLPNPKERDAAAPSGYVRQRARAIRAGAETLRAEGRDRCVF